MTYRFLFSSTLLAGIVLGLVAGAELRAQSFSMTPEVLTTTCDTNSYTETKCKVENLTDQPLSLRIVRTSAHLPAGWVASFCLVNCYSPDAVDVVDQLEPHQKAEFKLTWLTANVPAAGDVDFRFSNDAIPSEQFVFHFSVSTLTDAQEPGSMPKALALSQNYPNPFSLSSDRGARISFTTPRSAGTTMKVYNLFGREVRTLVNDTRPAGTHIVFWDALDNDGNRVAPGIYIYKVTSGGVSQSRRMLITR
jgi:hypothetical protein